MNASSVLLFLVVDVLLVLTPGPDWLYVIARSLSERGWRLGLVAVGGICTAYVAYTVLVATGLAAAVAAVPGVLPLLRYAGAAYLVFLAVMMLRATHRSRPTDAEPAARPHPPSSDGGDGSQLPHAQPAHLPSPHPQPPNAQHSRPPSPHPEAPAKPSQAAAAKVFGQSFLTGVLNPKALLLFLSLLPQFADPTAALPVGAQLAALGLLHVACCAAGYATIAVAAGRAGRRIASSTRLSRGLPFVSAALLLGVATFTVL